MIVGASWVCGWCGRKEPLTPLQSLFGWFRPGYCQATGKRAGWPHPSCRVTAELAGRIANKLADKAAIEFLRSVHGQSLGKLRDHELSDI
jgi:hypothetical protein